MSKSERERYRVLEKRDKQEMRCRRGIRVKRWRAGEIEHNNRPKHAGWGPEEALVCVVCSSGMGESEKEE